MADSTVRSAPGRHSAHPTVLVTGAGGPVAVTLIRALAGQATVVVAGDDPLAGGLYLVPERQRVLLPGADDPNFVTALLTAAQLHGAEVVIPTVDAELCAVSAARDQFARAGIRLLVESIATLATCLDSFALVQRCATRVRVPDTALFDAALLDTVGRNGLDRFGNRFIVRPRRSADGGRAVVITDPAQLIGLRLDGSILVQEYLPGTEYSIDVLARSDGHVVVAVPRTRDRVESGIAVAGRTVSDERLQSFGRCVAEAVGATGVVNVQARWDGTGTPALLGVNPRFPATMTLTVAAGVDMPALALAAALGRRLPDSMDFQEIAVVRHWAEVTVPVAEYGRLVPSRDHVLGAAS